MVKEAYFRKKLTYNIIKELLNILKETLNDKSGKFAIRFVIYCVLLIFLVFSFVIIGRIVYDKPVKIWGMEFNSFKLDTIKINNPSLNEDSLLKPNKTSKASKKIFNNKRILNVPSSALIKPQLNNIQTTIKGKNINTSSNSGSIGDNGHVINGVNLGVNGDQYIGIKQRHVGQQELENTYKQLTKLKAQYPHLKEKIIIIYADRDDEAQNLGAELKEKLKEKGLNVEVEYSITIVEKEDFSVFGDSSRIFITVNKPAKNIPN